MIEVLIFVAGSLPIQPARGKTACCYRIKSRPGGADVPSTGCAQVSREDPTVLDKVGSSTHGDDMAGDMTVEW